jgi:hypothetical protein
MWSLVPSDLGSEPLVLLTELLVFLAKLLILFAEFFVFFSEFFVFLSSFLEFLFQVSKMSEDLFFGGLRRSHEQTRRDGLRPGDHPSKARLLACCIDLRHRCRRSYERLPKSIWG